MKRLSSCIMVNVVFIVVCWYAVAASLSPNPKFTATDGNGNPRTGAYLYTYETGTTTPKTTWTDATEATPNTNPIVLDSNGQADVWLDASDGAYRFKLVSSTMVTLWTIDDIEDIGAVAGKITSTTLIYNLGEPNSEDRTVENRLQSSKLLSDWGGNLPVAIGDIGSSETTLVVDTPPDPVNSPLTIPTNVTLDWRSGGVLNGSSTVTLNNPIVAGKYQIFSPSLSISGSIVSPTLDPSWWGAKGDGVTDDTPALQGALNYAVSASATLDLGNKTYITTGLTLSGAADRLKIQNGTLKLSGSGIVLDINGVTALGFSNFSLENVVFDGGLVGDCFKITNHINLSIVGCTFTGYLGTGCYVGFGLGALEGIISRSYFRKYDPNDVVLVVGDYDCTGLRIDASDFLISQCVFSFNKFNIDVQGGSNFWTECHFYGATQRTISLDGSSSARRNIFDNCWINGRVVLQNADENCDHSFTNCLIKHEDYWINHGGTVWGYVFGLISGSATGELRGLKIVDNTFDGQSGGANPNVFGLISGTITTVDQTFMSPNVYVNGMNPIHHANVGGFKLVDTGEVDRDVDGRFCIGGLAGGVAGGYFKTQSPATIPMLHDLVGSDNGLLVAGSRYWDVDAGTYGAIFYTFDDRMAIEFFDGASTFTKSVIFDVPTASLVTGFTVLFMDELSALQTKRVLVGLPDSAGTGFRTIKVAN